MLAIGGSSVVYELDGPVSAVFKVGRWRDADIRARFAIEAEVLRAVGAPTAPTLIDAGSDDGWPYLILEHEGCETLATWMSRTQARGGIGEIIAILTRIATALGGLHEAGFAHRDLKPENVCIGSRGARLLDFGLAKRLRRAESGVTQLGTIVGTPHYMAPEQSRIGNAVDHRVDIYSFGVIAFEMLAGMPPFVGERRAIEYQHRVTRPPSLREVRAIPHELDELVARCLAKQPEARPQSAHGLQEALNRAMSSIATIRGVGAVSAPAPSFGAQTETALAWIVGGEPLAVARSISELHGTIVHQRGEGLLAAFSAAAHEAPTESALVAARDLSRERCRVVVHVTSALVRRAAHGKLMVYGPDIERTERWLPALPFAGWRLPLGRFGYCILLHRMPHSKGRSMLLF